VSHQAAPDPAAARLIRDHQSADFRAWLRLQMVRHTQVDPSDQLATQAGDVDYMIRLSGQRLDALSHLILGCRVAEFTAQRRCHGRVRAGNFANQEILNRHHK
jgi:hypothetical protein